MHPSQLLNLYHYVESSEACNAAEAAAWGKITGLSIVSVAEVHPRAGMHDGCHPL